VNKANDEMKMLDRIDTKKAARFLTFICMVKKFKNARLRNLDTTGTIVLNVYKANYIKYSSDSSRRKVGCFSKSTMNKDGTLISMNRHLIFQ
jgi:hypothetical protein